MAGVSTEEAGSGRSYDSVSTGQQQRCQSGEALAEWRSSEQVENGSSSTSPPYWDSDDDDDDGGLKPSDLYGKYTWKIDKFSQINKRELRSNAFEVGGYKWYILIYPQGCDVCNHLSLFLCVANHDKLLPGWSHFAQFTIAVVNKDPKKSKYSDTLHRFWKKEHDWGWKKFMELSKVYDGFIDADTLIIKAQVQVIRERADRPFRCLDCQYRRELVRVYLTNVEQICRRFVEERRTKLGKLLEDKVRWSSFCAFWLGMDQSSRRRMSREKTESILKVVVKHFFIEKEVTSTLVMDSLYSGLKSLEGQNKVKKSRGKHLEVEELPVPIIGIEKDTFILVDDVLLLLERAAIEPLPPKDEKGPQNRTKESIQRKHVLLLHENVTDNTLLEIAYLASCYGADSRVSFVEESDSIVMEDGNAGEEINREAVERDERRLTELGRRTIEIFVLAHIFSKIEVAYQEAVALKKQEELIREEEAAETELKARRGAMDKEKKSKKKQGKQKKNKGKGKDKGKDDKTSIDKIEEDSPTAEREEIAVDLKIVLEKPEPIEDVSDVSDSVDGVPETPLPDEERTGSPVNWDTDTSEVHHPIEASGSGGINGLSRVQNGTEGRIPSAVDDSSSTCSSDSVPSVRSVPHKGNSPYHHNQKSPNRGRKHQGKVVSSDWSNEEPRRPLEDAPRSSNRVEIAPQDKVVNGTVQRVGKKEEETRLSSKNFTAKVAVEVHTSPPRSPSNGVAFPKLEPKSFAPSGPALVKKPSSESPKQADNSLHKTNPSENNTISKPLPQKFATSKPSEMPPSGHQKQVANEKLPLQEVTEQKFTSSKPAEKPSGNQKPVGSDRTASQEAPSMTEKLSIPPIPPAMSRPLSAPIVPGPRPAVSVVSMVQTAPVLARSVSAAGRLAPETSAYATTSYVPQSYRNAMMGPVSGSSSTYSQNHSSNSAVNASHPYSQGPALSAPMFSPHSSDRMDPAAIKPSLSFGMMSHHDMLQSANLWMDRSQRNDSRNLHNDPNSLVNDMHNLDMNGPILSRSQDHLPSEFPAGTSGRQNHAFQDEFPHLDIINDLLDDEHGVGMVARVNSDYYQRFSSGPHMNRQYTFPGDPGPGPGPSASSCGIDRTRGYHDDGYQHGYGRNYDSLRDIMINGPASSRAYGNGPVDSYMTNQWQMGGSDLSGRNMDNDGYPYHIPEYPNLGVGINGYTVYRPSNGL